MWSVQGHNALDSHVALSGSTLASHHRFLFCFRLSRPTRGWPVVTCASPPPHWPLHPLHCRPQEIDAVVL